MVMMTANCPLERREHRIMAVSFFPLAFGHLNSNTIISITFN
jgi:hypothetical protein